jgi:hypothetical protein
VSTKVWPTVAGAHNSENLKKTFRESLVALKADKVDIFYLHAPDYSTPFEETIQAVDELYREGRFDRVTRQFTDHCRQKWRNLTTTHWDSPTAFLSFSPCQPIVWAVQLYCLASHPHPPALQTKGLRPSYCVPGNGMSLTSRKASESNDEESPSW